MAVLKNPQTFRVFFSSPFKGMEEEREELTRKYFPEIQHKCSEMGLQFVPVDMRWGISAESAQQAQTINICFREIDRSDMLVCFFAQRYGWHGHTDGLLQENIDAALGKYPWLAEARECSVTELELRHAHLNHPGNMPAVICFRDKKYDDVMKEMHKDKAANYMSEDSVSVERLAELRQKVLATREKTLAVHMDYPNPHDGARLMYEAVIRYLNEKVLKQGADLPRREKDLAPQKAFMASRTSLYVGNQDCFTALNQSLHAAKPDSEDSGTCPHILVLGSAGIGKSALLSNWLQDHVSQQPDVVVIPYFIGCAPRTRDPEALLDFVYGELEHYLEGSSKKEDVGQEHKSQRNSDADPCEINGHNQTSADLQNDAKSKTDSVNQTQASNLNDSKVPGDSDPTKSGKPGSSTSDQKSSSGGKAGDLINGNPVLDEQRRGADSDKKPDSQGKVEGLDASTDKGEKSTAPEKSDDDKQKSKAEHRPKGKALQHQVVKKLEKVAEGGQRVLLVFDAINRLVVACRTSKTLYWLPEKLPKGVLCVLSTDDTDQDSIKVLQTDRQFQVLQLEPLTEATQHEICVQTLKHSGKELSQAQLDRITKAQQTENPLFLKIVLNELSIFGYYRKLDEKIDSLIQVSNIKELIHNCLQRFEADYDDSTFEGNLVGEILKAIHVSHQGLTESEITNIFEIQSNVWSPFYFAMEYFIVSYLGNFGFAFAEFREAVKERYLHDDGEEAKAQLQLISYFDGIRKHLRPWMTTKKLSEKPTQHAVRELVWLQRKQEDRAGLIRSLTDLAVFRIMNNEHELELLELWQWTGLKWSDVCCRLLTALDCAIVDCYLATEAGELDTEKSPGVRLRVTVAHMRSFFDLANNLKGSEKVLEREIRILENAGGKMEEDKRKEYLRDAYYYLACTYASQDRYQEAKALHEANMGEFQRALAEKDDLELKKQIAYTHNGLGILCMHSAEYDKGIEHLIKSCEFHGTNADRKNEAAGYTNLGLIYMYKQDFAKALEYYNKALEAYEEGLFGQLSMDVGNLYTNIGLVYRRMRNLDKAEEAYLKSLQIKANAVGWDHVVIATASMNLGTLEMHRKNYAKAEEWTRKAIAVYQANEFEVTKKEYRRCRENLFANMLKQGKYEEVLPFFIEIFDILKQNGWLDECLAGMHRTMIEYMVENKPDLHEKAAEMCMALIDSPKNHPQNYGILLSIDLDLPEDKRVKRPYQYSLGACLDKFPTHTMYPTMVELKAENLLLPKEDKDGMRTLLKHVAANCTDCNFEEIISKLTTVAQEQKKEDFWFQCLKSLVDEDPTDKKILQLFMRLCIRLERPSDAVPYLDNFLNSLKEGGASFKLEDVKPSRTRLDVAKVLVAKGDTSQARELLLLVTSMSHDCRQKEEAKAALATLPEDKGDDTEALVTSAA